MAAGNSPCAGRARDGDRRAGLLVDPAIRAVLDLGRRAAESLPDGLVGGRDAGRDQPLLYRHLGAAPFRSVIHAAVAGSLVGISRYLARPRRARADWGSNWLVAFAAGAAAGAATLAKPSFAVLSRRTRLLAGRVRWPDDRPSFKDAFWSGLLILIGIVLVMSPWWIRNARTYGRFVPTSVWFGASLYDGLNPNATGAAT